MPPKKEKKAKNEKKPPGEGGPSGPTAEEAAAALKKRCARLEEEEKQVRDLCARLRQENADKKLTLEASRADSDEAEHLATTTADGDARERAAHVAQLTHETSLLRAAVAQLRAQRDRRDEVAAETDTLEHERDALRDQRITDAARHDARARADAEAVVAVRRQLEESFRSTLALQIQGHFDAAVGRLDAKAKEKLARTEELRAELALQRKGLVQVGQKAKDAADSCREVRREVKALEAQETAKALATAKERRALEAARLDAARLAERLDALHEETRRHVDAALSILPGVGAAAELDDGAAEIRRGDPAVAAALRRGAGALKANEASLKAHESKSERWGKRATALRRVAVDVRAGRRRGPVEDRTVARFGLDRGDPDYAALDAPLFREVSRLWSEEDADLVEARSEPALTAAKRTSVPQRASAPALPPLATLLGEAPKRRSPRKQMRRSRSAGSDDARGSAPTPTSVPARLPRRAPNSLAAAQMRAFRSIERFQALQESYSAPSLSRSLDLRAVAR